MAFPRWLLLPVMLFALTADAGKPGGRRAKPLGPDDIPPPPLLLNRGVGHDAWAKWYAALTPRQRRFFDRYCSNEDNAYTTLCGGTPLVAVFDSRPVEFIGEGAFAFAPGDPVLSAWPSTRAPWLARDLDGNGVIDSGAELFGSNTVLPDGRLARDGFEALAALDANGDGVLDERDPAFASLLLWFDANGDRISSPDELVPLSRWISSIALHARAERRCDDRGNCEILRSPMRWRDAGGATHEGEIVDVFLSFRPIAAPVSP